MNYFGYCRVSTPTQVTEGFGLQAQEQAIQKYADEHDFTLTDIFFDKGVSGAIDATASDDAITKRTGLISLLATVKNGDCVVVLNTNRLWRSELAKAIVKRELLRAGVSVISVEQPDYRIDSKNPEEVLVASILEAIDTFDKMQTVIKMARGRTTKAMGGNKPAGVTPCGYKYSADRKHIEIDEAEAATVKRIFSMAQRGNSLQAIADALNADGIQTRRGNEWSKQGIATILKNDFYTGKLHHGEQVIEGAHPALISKVTYGKVQAALARRHK